MQSRALDDDELETAFADDPDRCRRALVERYSRLIHSFCRRALSDRDAARVTAEVFTTATGSGDRYHPDDGSLAGWLMALAQRRVDEAHRGTATRPAAARHIDLNVLGARLLVADALEHVADRTRTMLHLAHFEGLSQEEIAERTGSEPDDVQRVIDSGLTDLRRHLTTFDSEPAAGADFEREIAVLGSLSGEPVIMHPPPADLWARIEAGRRPTKTANDASPSFARRPIMIAIVAAVVAIGLTVGLMIASGDGGTTTLARAVLEPYRSMDLGPARASAALEDRELVIVLRVNAAELPRPASGTHYEVWLLDGDPGVDSVSLGRLDGADEDVVRALPVPSGTDTDRFDTVDISIQDDDGGSEHSGNSILRGTLS